MFGKSVNTDYLISLLLSIVDDTLEMETLYRELTPFLDAEIKMVRSRNYENIDAIVDAKVQHVTKIESVFDKMSEVSRQLTFLHRENFYDTSRNADSLSATFEMFEDFYASLCGKNVLVEQTVQHNLIKFRKAIEALARVQAETKPLIEFNRTVTTEISKNYQLSMRFWEELSQEQSSSYTAQGVRQSTHGLSTIIAKA